ncbi:MAG: MarR family transcriptional regulator [Alphaproteobacteria bacterium]|nr:MarR family transcriptional regulator [Alphaproteobacteria bacterium]
MTRHTGIDTSFLEGLLGYNARRAALVIIEHFVRGMAEFDLRPVDFSVLSVIHHNPGVTSRELCASLNLLPPNLVGLIRGLEQRGLIERQPHPLDRRAQGLHATAAGIELMQQAETRASSIEREVATRLSPQEQAQLIEMLQRIYLN